MPSDPELAWLYGTEDLPPRSRVWLGAFDARGRILVSTKSRPLTSAPARGAAAPAAAHMTTLTIGHVLLQVFSTNFVPPTRSRFPPTMPARRGPTPGR